MKTHGELLVTGKDHINIRLDAKPEHVHIFFKDDVCDTHPCNPKHYNELDWEVKEVKHLFSQNVWHLIIRWDVSGTKEIDWTVKF